MTADLSNPARRASRVPWKLLTLAVVVLALGGLMFRAYQLGKNAENQSAAILNQLRAAGEPTTMPELARRHASFGTNGNAAAFFDELFTIQPDKLPFKLDRKTSSPPKLGSNPDEGKLNPDDVIPDELAAEYRDFVRTNAGYFARADKITDGPRYAVQPLDFNAGMNMILPHISKFKQTAILLQARCYWNIHERNVEGALHDVELIMRVSDALAPEEILICFLVRQACGTIALTCAERLLNHVELTDQQLSRLRKTFETYPNQSDMRAAMVGERTFGLNAFEVPPGIPTMPPSAGQGSKGWHEDRLLYLQSMGRLVAATTLPIPDGLRESKQVETDAMNLMRPSSNKFWNWFNMAVRRRYIITSNFIPALGNAIAKSGTGLARVRLLEIATEIERFNIAHGRFPDSLAEIRALSNSPDCTDPFTGKDMIYRKTEQGYLIYSVGPDLKDDNGAREKPSRRGMQNEDITFQVSVENRAKP